tara:strand:+ start:417 stop:1697 length:1281 start_codon:yes stop_codon:yes gene_type:complete
MNKFICVVLFFISGILIYQILKMMCKCNLQEGNYGYFGRVYLQKCCPETFMFSNTLNECVAICDNCTINSHKEKLLIDNNHCSNSKASEVYDYNKINRLYKKDQLLNQLDFYSDLFSDSASGVQPAEESGSIGSGSAKFTADVDVKIDRYFYEIPEGYYYTSENECDSDYERYSSLFPNAAPLSDIPNFYINGTLVDEHDCRGHWKLDLTEEQHVYIKDNDRLKIKSNWKIDRTNQDKPEGVETQKYYQDNASNVRRIMNSIGNISSPVYKEYEEFLNDYEERSIRGLNESLISTKNTINGNRKIFCNNLRNAINQHNANNENNDDIDINNTSLYSSGNNSASYTYTYICNSETDTDNFNYMNISTLCDNNMINIDNINNDNKKNIREHIKDSQGCFSPPSGTPKYFLCPDESEEKVDENKQFQCS